MLMDIDLTESPKVRTSLKGTHMKGMALLQYFFTKGKESHHHREAAHETPLPCLRHRCLEIKS